MEVASPLPFSQGKAGTKRAFGCSLFPDGSNTSVVGMEVSEDHILPSSKRRRFAETQVGSPDTHASPSFNPFASMNWQGKAPNHHCHSTNGASLKRSRAEDDASHVECDGRDIRVVVYEQASEIEGLKRDKASLESSVNELRGENEKVINENRILKRAVAIQQERQNQSASELDAAQRYKVDADDRMRKLEQMILTLRYHLQTQGSSTGNDFMAPPPPDVY